MSLHDFLQPRLQALSEFLKLRSVKRSLLALFIGLVCLAGLSLLRTPRDSSSPAPTGESSAPQESPSSIATPLSLPSAEDFQPSYFAQWRFDENSDTTLHNAQGICANSCTGLLHNFFSPDSSAPPVSGWTRDNRFWGESALSFDGQDDFIEIPGSPGSEELALPAEASIELWVKPENLQPWSRFLAWQYRGQNLQIGTNQDNNLAVQLQTPQKNIALAAGAGLTPDIWHQILLVKNQNELDLYLNGIIQDLSETDPFKTNPDASLSALYLGAYPVEPSAESSGTAFALAGAYKGAFDAASIYDQAYEPGQVATLFQQGFDQYRDWSGNDGSGVGDGSGSAGQPGSRGASYFLAAAKPDQNNSQSSFPFEITNTGKGLSQFRIGPGGPPEELLPDKKTPKWADVDQAAWAGFPPPTDYYQKQDGTAPWEGAGGNGPLSGLYTMVRGGDHTIAGVKLEGSVWKKKNNETIKPAMKGSSGRIPLDPFKGIDKEQTAGDTKVSHPALLSDFKQWRAFYSCNDGATTRICEATGGLDNWNKIEKPVLDISKKDSNEQNKDAKDKLDDTHVSDPAVLIERDVDPRGERELSGQMHLLYAGNDGATWRIFQASDKGGNPIVDLKTAGEMDKSQVRGPSIGIDIRKRCRVEPECAKKRCCNCEETGRTYHLFYEGNDGATWRIFDATYQTNGPQSTLPKFPQASLALDISPSKPGETSKFGDDAHVRAPSVFIQKFYKSTVCDCGETPRCEENQDPLFHLQYTGDAGGSEFTYKATRSGRGSGRFNVVNNTFPLKQ